MAGEEEAEEEENVAVEVAGAEAAVVVKILEERPPRMRPLYKRKKRIAAPPLKRGWFRSFSASLSLSRANSTEMNSSARSPIREINSI